MKKTISLRIKTIFFAAFLSLLLFAQATAAMAAKKPTKVKLSQTKITLTVGEKVKLTATVKPTTGNVDRTVTWSSSDKKIASVSKKGRVTAKKAGTATITVTTVNGKKATCKVTVKKPKVKLAIVDSSMGSDCVNLMNCAKRCGANVDFISSTNVDATEYDGLLIPGGNDIDPSTYHSANYGAVSTSPSKDAMQKKVIKKFIKAGKPIFGVCRGMQLINVYFGGTLNQNISGHRGEIRTVSILKGSFAYSLYGKTESVYHTHHQSCAKIGTGLKVTQTDKQDGTVEAIEHTKYQIYGVQWHPELMGTRGQKLIKSFVTLCKKTRDAVDEESETETNTTTNVTAQTEASQTGTDSSAASPAA